MQGILELAKEQLEADARTFLSTGEGHRTPQWAAAELNGREFFRASGARVTRDAPDAHGAQQQTGRTRAAAAGVNAMRSPEVNPRNRAHEEPPAEYSENLQEQRINDAQLAAALNASYEQGYGTRRRREGTDEVDGSPPPHPELDRYPTDATDYVLIFSVALIAPPQIRHE